MKKKITAVPLAASMLLAQMPAALAAKVSYEDTAGHWAEAAIDRWSDYGIVQGDNGRFDPDGRLTRAQAAIVFAKLLGLEQTADVSAFMDVPADAWYADAMAKCYAAGILKGEATVSGAAGSVGSVVAGASVTVDSAAVGKVEVSAAASAAVAVAVTGGANIEVTVNSANGVTITGSNVTVSTDLTTAPDGVTVNGTPAAHLHHWDNGSVTTEATLTTDGEKIYTCTGCRKPRPRPSRIPRPMRSWRSSAKREKQTC